MEIMQALATAAQSLSYLRTVREVSASVDSLAQVANAQAALIDVQNEVLKLQQLALQMQQENRELLQKVATADRRSNYRLVSVGGVMVYQSKPSSDVPEHYVCPVCLDRNEFIAYLQPNADGLWCNSCRMIV